MPICWCSILLYTICTKNGLFTNWLYRIVRSVYVTRFLFGLSCVCKPSRCNRHFYVINLNLKHRLIRIIKPKRDNGEGRGTHGDIREDFMDLLKQKSLSWWPLDWTKHYWRVVLVVKLLNYVTWIVEALLNGIYVYGFEISLKLCWMEYTFCSKRAPSACITDFKLGR